MLTGIEDVDDIHMLVRYLVNNLVSPFGYRPVVLRLIGQVFLSGVFFREVSQALGQLEEGHLYMFGCTHRVFSNMS